MSHPDILAAAAFPLAPETGPDEAAKNLYETWYLRRDEAPSASASRNEPGASNLPVALRAAHHETEVFEPEWHVEKISSYGRVIVARGGESRVVTLLEIVAPDDACLPPPPGSEVAVAARLDSCEISPGFWVAASQGWDIANSELPLVRVYWNLPVCQTPTLVDQVTRILGDSRTAYLLKVALPEADGTVHRADRAVLYLVAGEDPALPREVTAIYSALGAVLVDGSPRLTLPLARGVAVAEDPGDAQSFGQHRCRIIAEALTGEGRELPPPNTAEGVVRRAAAIAEEFEARGLDPDRPYLGPGSRRNYRLRARGRAQAHSEQRLTGNRASRPLIRPLPDPPQTWALESAVGLAWRLANEAIWHAHRCTWLGASQRDNGEAVIRSMDGDLYEGTAGIGWVLAHMARLATDGALADVARGALCHALDWGQQTSATGLFSGSLGVAWAVVEGALAIADRGLVKSGCELAQASGSRLRQEGTGASDLIAGDAGTILALIALGRRLEDEDLAKMAGELALHLAQRARPVGPWRAWTPDLRVNEPPLCGLGHGASGPAWALLEASTLARRELVDIAHAALAYERAWLDSARGGWPDLRGVVGPIDPLVYVGAPGRKEDASLNSVNPAGPYWCHGAAGIGLARIAAWRHTGQPVWLAEATYAVDITTRSAAAALARPYGERPFSANVSLCHGVGSAVELHLEAAAATGNEKHIIHAERLLTRALGLSPGQILDADAELACGVFGAGEAPGLMLGLAGVVALLARLGSPGRFPRLGLLPT
jgi:hypothetical protein